jgi:molybdate transport system substrate-binding protein
MNFKKFFKSTIAASLIVLSMVSLTACNNKVAVEPTEEDKPQLLFYIGITMVKPIAQLVEEFEKENNCEIIVSQGGSQDLYDSLKQSQQGDLYMPGSYSYRKNNLGDGILLDDAVLVGYNKASIVVAKGNPLGFTNDLVQLSNPENRVVICNPDSGSIGKETKKILEAHGTFDEVFSNAIYLTTDSRNLTDAIANKDADICINWHATTAWEGNRENVDAILIDEEYAKKKMLILSLTSFSEEPELTKKFMEYASSEHGRQVFKDYGFLDDKDLETIDGVTFE